MNESKTDNTSIFLQVVQLLCDAFKHLQNIRFHATLV